MKPTQTPICARRSRRSPRAGQQRGVVLIIAMIVLLASAIMAISAMQNLGFNERMAGNFKDRQVAFQAAEATLRDAELVVRSNATGHFSPLRARNFSPDCSNGLCSSPLTGTPTFLTFTDANWEAGAETKTKAYGAESGAPELSGLADEPRYAIAYQGTTDEIERGKPCIALFSVVARAPGANSATLVTLESVFRLRVGECYESI